MSDIGIHINLLPILAGPVLLLVLLLLVWLVVWRRRRREAYRNWAQLGSIYDSQMRRGRRERK